MKQYQIGDTAFIMIEHQTYDFETNAWSLANPDSGFPKITIIDPDGETPVEADEMDPVAKGKFQYLYAIVADGEYTPPPGIWIGYIQVENGGYPDKQYISFYVQRAKVAEPEE